MFFARISTCLVLLFLTACTNFVIGEGQGLLDAAVQNGATKHRIYVGTTRALSEDPEEFFSGERSKELTLAHVDVTVPPNHKPGKIEKPKSVKTNPLKHFAVSDPKILSNPGSFRDDINKRLASLEPENQEVLVFVHGYNVSFSAAVLRITQFVHDTGFEGVPVLFSWASRGKTADYVYDINSALQGRDNLVKLATVLNQTSARRFDVVAHSMGNLVTIEAMRQIVKTNRFGNDNRLRLVMMASPDIDLDLFETQLKDFGELKKLFFVFISSDDIALAASTTIAGGISRVGSADPERLAALGVNVIDLSDIEDTGSINHSKFSESPEIVQIIGKGIKEGNTLNAQSAESVAASATGDLVRSVTVIPAGVIGGASSLIVRLGNQ